MPIWIRLVFFFDQIQYTVSERQLEKKLYRRTALLTSAL